VSFLAARIFTNACHGKKKPHLERYWYPSQHLIT